jgi:AP endonuclease-1
MDKKQAWNAAFEVYLRQLDANKPVIWTGDINCTPTEAGEPFLPSLGVRLS